MEFKEGGNGIRISFGGCGQEVVVHRGGREKNKQYSRHIIRIRLQIVRKKEQTSQLGSQS